ncbi:MAG: S1/P1 Nuclease [Bacteroidetes bacterium]|nr:S1/P1 Nuclease [Bacteroidota bacterium]
MKTKLTFLFSYLLFSSWGFQAHKSINRSAVFILPDELFGFYKKHLYFIEDQAVAPDQRRYVDTSEAPRHYLDADFYESELPLDTIPRFWNDVISKYGEDTVLQHGIVTWHVVLMVSRLSNAFSEHNLKRILRLSADLGHYVGDLHVPLHSTHNYNGQLTGQEGIHGLWESRLIELYSDDFDVLVGKAEFLESVSSAVWNAFEESVRATDSVLYFEKVATQKVGEGKKYSYENRNGVLTRVYSEKFCREYFKLLDHMVERRMRASIKLLGSLWMTAWINAGQPDLTLLNQLPDSLEMMNADSVLPEHNIIGRPEWH